MAWLGLCMFIIFELNTRNVISFRFPVIHYFLFPHSLWSEKKMERSEWNGGSYKCKSYCICPCFPSLWLPLQMVYGTTAICWQIWWLIALKPRWLCQIGFEVAIATVTLISLFALISARKCGHPRQRKRERGRERACIVVKINFAITIQGEDYSRCARLARFSLISLRFFLSQIYTIYRSSSYHAKHFNYSPSISGCALQFYAFIISIKKMGNGLMLCACNF